MRVTPPLLIDETRLTGVNVPEGEAVWAPGPTAYAKGARVRPNVAGMEGHRLFESLTAGNTGHDPLTDDGTNWLDVGYTNRWAMFDQLRNTGTVSPSPIAVQVRPGQRVDSLGLVGMVADRVNVQVYIDVPGSGLLLVYDRTVDLSTRKTRSWYEYTFRPFTYRSAIVLYDLPPYTSAIINVTISRATGDVTCGGLIVGMSEFIGDAQQQGEADRLNFSTIDRDFDGTAVLVPRRTVPKTSVEVVANKTLTDRLLYLQDKLNAVPALWSAVDDSEHDYFGAFLILGVYKRWTINAAGPTHTVQNIDLEEV